MEEKTQDDRKSKPQRVVKPYPPNPLEEVLTVVRAIGDMNAGRPMDRLLLADALGRKQASSDFRTLLSSSNKYGLTEGSEKSEYISPTELGLRIIKPTSDEERLDAIRLAALTPESFKRIFDHYNRSKLPQGAFFINTLERAFGVPAQYCEELARLIHLNASTASFIQSTSGDPHIMLKGTPPSGPAIVQDVEDTVVADEFNEESIRAAEPQTSSAAPSPPQTISERAKEPKQIFIAHGKNRQPLEQLKKVLDKFKIPYKIAVDEPHAGRPISQKVASLMDSCSAAIFVFTKDEEFRDTDGNAIWRPSENVVYELGAASVLYGNKIIIFKEEGIKFASDFQDLGYITFAPGELQSKALDLLSELIAFEFIRVQPV